MTLVTCLPHCWNLRCGAGMTLTALLVCIDEAAAKVLHRVLEELSIRVESCPDFARAAIRLAQERFDVVIVDSESNAEVVGAPAAALFAARQRAHPQHARALAVHRACAEPACHAQMTRPSPSGWWRGRTMFARCFLWA